MKNVLIIAFVLLTSLSAYSKELVTGAVERIYPNTDNKVYLRLKNDTNCNPNNSYYYYFSLDSNIEKAWYSLLLSAATTGKEVTILVESCPTSSNVEIRYLLQDF